MGSASQRLSVDELEADSMIKYFKNSENISLNNHGLNPASPVYSYADNNSP